MPSSCASISRRSEAGTRVGLVIMATLFGMALGGWMSRRHLRLHRLLLAAFANGLAWNLLNVLIVLWLLIRPGQRIVTA